jgi:hypothetical protein
MNAALMPLVGVLRAHIDASPTAVDGGTHGVVDHRRSHIRGLGRLEKPTAGHVASQHRFGVLGATARIRQGSVLQADHRGSQVRILDSHRDLENLHSQRIDIRGTKGLLHLGKVIAGMVEQEHQAAALVNRGPEFRRAIAQTLYGLYICAAVANRRFIGADKHCSTHSVIPPLISCT